MEYINETNEGNGIFRLEHKLMASLKPVIPNKAFVERLKGKLTSGTTTILEHKDDYLGFVAIGVGLAIGALAIWLARKSK
jgi:hypothetical protein